MHVDNFLSFYYASVLSDTNSYLAHKVTLIFSLVLCDG